jgi:ethanolamine utilization protein EutJ
LTLAEDGRWHVGVDLGTAYVVMVVLDERFQVLAGEYRFAQIARDGLVVDFMGAVDLVKGMKARLEERLGKQLIHAATGFPPGVHSAEVRATGNVLEAAGLDCSGLIDEPSAANHLLRLRDGAIIDVGGGTTGIAIVRDGKVVYTADEPTGGTHFSLVIAGALNIDLEKAENLKKKPSEQARLFPLIRPVMEKVGTIAAKHFKGQVVHSITLVGGTACFPGMPEVISEVTGKPTRAPQRPLFVTPIGIAMHDTF